MEQRTQHVVLYTWQRANVWLSVSGVQAILHSEDGPESHLHSVLLYVNSSYKTAAVAVGG